MEKLTEKFTISVKLYQQTPMLHFQWDENGAALRPSEVKPKLDRFIIMQLGGWEKAYNDHPDWFMNDDRPALKYKLRIVAPQDGLRIVGDSTNGRNRKTIPSSYFANMGGERLSYKEGVIYDKPLSLKINCLIPGLKEFIEDGIWGKGKSLNLRYFFWATNFGTRSNKGFGGFSTKEEFDFYDIQEGLWKVAGLYGLGKIYYIDYYNRAVDLRDLSEYRSDYDNVSVGDIEAKNSSGGIVITNDAIKWVYFRSWQQLTHISELYRLLKTGYNNARSGNSQRYVKSFIYRYAHKFGIRNEKSWMKTNRISPNVVTHDTGRAERTEHRYEKERYVRAILGVGDELRYKSDRNGFEKIKIKLAGIDRVPSPLVFKVFPAEGGGSTFILPFEQSKRVISKERVKGFFSSRLGRGRIELLGPDDGVTVSGLMEEFLKYVNYRGNLSPDCYRTVRDEDGRNTRRYYLTDESKMYLSHPLDDDRMPFSLYFDFSGCEDILEVYSGGDRNG